MLQEINIRPYEDGDLETVVGLWQRCGLVVPWNDPRKDIARKLQISPELFFVAERAGVVVATAMAGYDGHRGWINYLAVSPGLRRSGVGRMMMARAESELRLRGCPKINIQVRSSNSEVAAFYRSIGFIEDDVISLGKRLEEDSKE